MNRRRCKRRRQKLQYLVPGDHTPSVFFQRVTFWDTEPQYYSTSGFTTEGVLWGMCCCRTL